MSDQKNMIVEFVGIAGSGKTTISEKVAKELRKMKVPGVLTYSDISIVNNYNSDIKRNFARMIILVNSLLKRPFAIKKLAKVFLSKNKNSESKIKGVNLISRSVGIQELAEKNRFKILLLDEAPIKGIHSFTTENSPSPKNHIEKYLNFVSLNFFENKHLFVFINSNLEKSIKRRKKRNGKSDKKFFRKPSSEYRKNIVAIENQKINEERLKSILLKKNIPFIEVENNKHSDIEKAANKIVKFIDKDLKALESLNKKN